MREKINKKPYAVEKPRTAQKFAFVLFAPEKFLAGDRALSFGLDNRVFVDEIFQLFAVVIVYEFETDKYNVARRHRQKRARTERKYYARRVDRED